MVSLALGELHPPEPAENNNFQSPFRIAKAPSIE